MSKGASREYRQSKQLSRYKLLAQKLSQHLQNLAQDPNTRTRWIWQLIQNAKDVPNEFNKVKIKIEITDNQLKFSHNGDPFRTSDLESVVSQYSSKPQENKMDSETTGKYGTGFITTYILSRKLKIQGLIKITVPLEDSESDSSEGQEKKQRADLGSKTIMFTGEESQIKQKKQSHYEISQDLSLVNKIGSESLQQSKRQLIRNEQSMELIQIHSEGQSDQEKQIKIKKQTPNIPMKDFFQKFKIRLDRSYTDRDSQFIQKLIKGQEKIIKKLDKLKRQQVWKRGQNDFDTSFIYEKLDKASFQIISLGINTLKDLFPYALLFNNKLHEIKVQDNRKERGFNNFIIRKEKYQKLGVLNVSVCKIIDFQGQKEIEKIVKHIYKTEDSSASNIAIPVEIQNNKVKLLAIKPGTPKIFKEFPLIGANDTGYNYVFTSRKFYPNETRSNLMLKRIQGRNSRRTETNWQVLEQVFETARTLFNMLPNFVSQNQENFFLLKECPFLGNNEAYFEKENKQFKQRILSYRIIKNIKNKMVSIQDIVYFRDQSKVQGNKNIDMSNRMNEIFKFLLPKEKQIQDQLHERLFDRLQPKQWNNCITRMNFQECLKKIIEIGYKNLVRQLGDREQAFSLMKKIYKLMNDHAPEYLDYKNPKAKHKIYLTNNYEFRSLVQLKEKHKMPLVYEQISKILGIDMDSFLIHDDMISYFRNVPKFTLIHAEESFHELFGVEPRKENITKENLKLMIQFCRTLDIHNNLTDIATTICYFQSAIPFNVDLAEFKKLEEKIQRQYKGHLGVYLLNYIQKQWFDKSAVSTINNMISNLNLGKKNGSIGAKKWFNQLLAIQKMWAQPLKIIKKSLSWSGKFVENQTLKYMQEYPQEIDLEFYEKMRKVYNDNQYKKPYQNPFFKYQVQLKESLKNELLDPQITYRIPHKLVSYSQMFSFSMKLFTQNLLEQSLRKYFLIYSNKLIKENQKESTDFTRNKVSVFKKIRLSRHYQMLQLMNMNEQEVNIVYDIITQHRGNLHDIIQLLENYEVSSIKDIMKENSLCQPE